MATAPSSAKTARPRRVRSFWTRVTEGLEIEQLWGQFKSEARVTYGLYSKDVDWDAISLEKNWWKRPFLAAWALFQAMLMKLSPARRVLLLLAVFFIVIQINLGGPRHQVSFDSAWLGTLILFVLLALELGDRVTMKRDLEIAREIQQWLVPEKPPVVPGIDMAFATRPQNTVAGDYYDAFVRPASAGNSISYPLLVAVADVAGKSVPAALLMATFQASLRALSATPASLDEIVVGLDRYCRAHSLEGRRFTTAFLAEIDPATREMRYVNAGHNAPILRRESGAIERLEAGGPPFGLPLFTGSEIPYPSASVQLQPGDLLFIFTDGVAEAISESGDEYTEQRLIACLRSAATGTAAEILNRVMADVNAFAAQARQHDDITCLAVRVGA
ncbi:MAG TPA: PP2C family protein-serine/threonine phosphatase [Candidatus Acidoferrales bacterium]|jgi:serine phosphatase RsbU (regulator of sigma subunit)|nr:PP2C family protein-serine/threonine phosphatase [Candidatus Acidoferrales bacterium]